MAPPPFVEHCLELFAPLGAVRWRRMFGGFGIYVDDIFLAIIGYDRLFLKVDDATRERFVAAGCEPFVYNAREQAISLGYWSAPADAMDSPALMAPWARLALQAAVSARAKAGKSVRPPARAARAAATRRRPPLPPRRG